MPRIQFARLPLAAAALIVTGAACATALGSNPMTRPAEGHSARTTENAPLRCELRLSDTSGGGVEVTALAHADRPLSGSYALDIRQHSAGGGSASVRQSGNFDAAPGTPAKLTQSRFSGSRANLEASLTLTSGTLESRCAKGQH